MLCREYMDTIALNQSTFSDVGIQTEALTVQGVAVQTDKPVSRNVRLQVAMDTPLLTPNPPAVRHTTTQTSSTDVPQKVVMKNKLVQCSLDRPRRSEKSEKSEVKVFVDQENRNVDSTGRSRKPSKAEKDVIVINDSLGELKNGSRIISKKESTKRAPLGVIDFNIISDNVDRFKSSNSIVAAKKDTVLKVKKEEKRMKKNKKPKAFRIYSDDEAGPSRKQLHESMQSGAKQKHSINQLNESGAKQKRANRSRLRPREERPNYAESGIILKRTKRRRKPTKKVVAPPLENIISMIHDSLMLSMRQ